MTLHCAAAVQGLKLHVRIKTSACTPHSKRFTQWLILSCCSLRSLPTRPLLSASGHCSSATHARCGALRTAPCSASATAPRPQRQPQRRPSAAGAARPSCPLSSASCGPLWFAKSCRLRTQGCSAGSRGRQWVTRRSSRCAAHGCPTLPTWSCRYGSSFVFSFVYIGPATLMGCAPNLLLACCPRKLDPTCTCKPFPHP